MLRLTDIWVTLLRYLYNEGEWGIFIWGNSELARVDNGSIVFPHVYRTFNKTTGSLIAVKGYPSEMGGKYTVTVLGPTEFDLYRPAIYKKMYGAVRILHTGTFMHIPNDVYDWWNYVDTWNREFTLYSKAPDEPALEVKNTRIRQSEIHPVPILGDIRSSEIEYFQETKVSDNESIIKFAGTVRNIRDVDQVDIHIQWVGEGQIRESKKTGTG